MVKIKVTQGGETLNLEADEEMRRATDEQVLGFVNETLHKEPPLRGNEFQVERTAEGFMVHPAPQYG